jgi:hypothetical protein
MEIKELTKKQGIEQNKRLVKAYDQFNKLLSALKKKELPDELIVDINDRIDQINSTPASDKSLRTQVKKAQSKVLKLVEKELKLVPKNHYRNLWMALGMAAFGVPLGVAFGTSLDNMTFLAIGLPIGMVIGLGVGSGLDQKALKEGRQLDIEL